MLNEAEQKNLAEAAREIHQLLEQLSKTYPITETEEKIIVAREANAQIENNTTLKNKTDQCFERCRKISF